MRNIYNGYKYLCTNNMADELDTELRENTQFQVIVGT